MAVNKSNGLLKILAVVMAVVVGGVFMVAKNGSNKGSNSESESDVVYDLSDDEANALGITAGDTPHDTLKTLLGALRDTREEVRKANERNDRLEKENDRMREREAKVDERIAGEVESRIESRLASAWDSFNRQIEDMKERVHGISNRPQFSPEPESMPIGGGFGAETGSEQRGMMDSKGVRWFDPDDMVITDEQGKPVADNYTGKTKASFPSPFKAEGVNSTAGTALNPETGAENTTSNSLAQKTKRTPYYTIAENSTLMGSTAMTALLGRVPIQGAVTDPFPFKVLIGRENLIANGIDLPDVEGAIVSGTSSGDWTLSCVRSNVTSITFVFADGRISNGRASNTNGLTSNANAANSGNGSIGWLSNSAGVPCIPGERKTNAKEYLGSQFLLAGASAAAQSLSQGQVTTVVDGGAVTSAMTGNTGQYVLGQALSGGLSEMENWYRQRYGQMFDAIYVPPGQEVAVHITADLEIDYDTGARKVKYNNKRTKRGMD